MSVSAEPSKPTILFFDNDGKNLRDFHLNRTLNTMFSIINILVDDKKPNEFCGDKTETESQKLEYINHFKRFGNSYAEVTLINGGEPVMPSRGITSEQHTELLKNIDRIPGEKIAIFDWDRTITVIEGMLNIQDHSMIVDMIVYLCGGEERLSRLQEMFRELHGKRVEVFILSNNAYADKSNSEETFELFKQLLKILDPDMDDVHIIGCIRNKKTRIIKSQAFLERYLSMQGRMKASISSRTPASLSIFPPGSPGRVTASRSSLVPTSPGRVAISSPRSSPLAASAASTTTDDEDVIKISYAKNPTNPTKKIGGKKTAKRKTKNNKRTKRKTTKK